MKGPYQRLKFDLRRLWECPTCNRRERTPGWVSSCFCQCQTGKADGQPVVMKLLADGAQRVTPPVVLQHELSPEPTVVEPAMTETGPTQPEVSLVPTPIDASPTIPPLE